MNTAASQCPNCQAPFHAGDVFCEQCGTRLAEDEPPASEQDRVELDLAVAAAVSDRGRVHRRNEDSFFLEVSDGGVAAVICDGISSASAGTPPRAMLPRRRVRSRSRGGRSRPRRHGGDDGCDPGRGRRRRVAPWTTRTGRVDPSCTLVSALRRGDEVVIGWVGDSRAYWLDAEDTRQLTIDDSLAEEGIAPRHAHPRASCREPRPAHDHELGRTRRTRAPAAPRDADARPTGPAAAVHRRSVELQCPRFPSSESSLTRFPTARRRRPGLGRSPTSPWRGEARTTSPWRSSRSNRSASDEHVRGSRSFRTSICRPAGPRSTRS